MKTILEARCWLFLFGEPFYFYIYTPPGNIISMGFVISVCPHDISRLDRFLYAIDIKQFSRGRKGPRWHKIIENNIRLTPKHAHALEFEVISTARQ